jgi:hypothetical protein
MGVNMTKKLTVTEWRDLHIAPLENEETLQEILDSGFDGWMLDAVLSVKNIDGDEATDGECLELVGELILHFYQHCYNKGANR